MVNYARLLQTFLDLIRLKADSGHEEPVVQYILPRLLQLGLIIRRGAEGRAKNNCGLSFPNSTGEIVVLPFPLI